MKHHWRGLARFAAGVALLAALFVVASANRQADAAPQGVTFSAASGFYDAPFWLEMSGGGGDIYYTLDSSDPDENATLYTGPIRIDDASDNENVYSMIADVALDLNPEYLTDNGAKPRFPYELPEDPVDKATVVRAVCVDAFGNRGEVTTAVYFVGFGEKEGYDGIKIMAIATDPDNLFDYERGIYVLGKKFGDILEDGKIVVPQQSNYLFWEANYRQKGSDWEREAYVCCFDENGETVMEGSYGIRTQGRGTRARLPKGLNIFGRKKYGSPIIDGEKLFGVPYELTTLNLATGGNGMDLMLRDYIVNVLAFDMRVGAREYEPCALFLDGEYWGIYWLTPRHKKDYLTQRYGVRASNIVEIKEGELEIGRETDMKLYEDMVSYIADHDMRLPENYARACELVDMDSCLDYYALEIYIGNIDWPTKNLALWRTRSVAPGAYSDGRWRWLLYDVNLAIIGSMSEKNRVQSAVDNDPMFASLMANPDFAQAFRERLVNLAADTFEPGRVKEFVEDYRARMSAPMAKKYTRFYGENKTVKNFNSGCDKVEKFFAERHDYIIGKYGGTDE